MKRILRIFLLMLLACTQLRAGDYPIGWVPEKGSTLVNDLCGTLTPRQREKLEARLVAFDDTTSNQIMVLITPSLGGDAIESFSHKVAQSWGVGSKEHDNGVVIIVKPKTDREDGQVRIEVGYGLEGALPDLFCRSIIDDDMIPEFRNDNYYEGILQAVKVIERVCAGEYSYVRRQQEQRRLATAFLIVLGLLVGGVAFLVIYSKRHPDRFPLLQDLSRDLSSPRGGYYGHPGSYGPFGGSPWGGYGGASRGGFSGFGGFGGGHFGGGGASGRW